MKNPTPIYYLFFFLVLCIFSSCKDAPIEFTPVAKFSIIRIDKELVEFRNNSINSTEFLWDFGDGTTSTERDPIHIYSEIGDYTVVLTAKLESKTHQTSLIATVSKIFPEELTELGNPPFGASADAISFSWDGKGYVGFGASNFQWSKSMWEFNPIDETWKQLADGPKDFIKACRFMIDGKVYMGLGQAPWGDGAREFYQYDIATDTYTSVGLIPLSSNTNTSLWTDLVSFSYQGKGYVIVAQGDFNGDVVVMEFNPDDLSWVQKSDFPGTATTGMTHFILDGFAYIGMGDQSGLSGYSTVKDFWKYDIVNDTWTSLSDFPEEGRRDAIGFIYDGKGYIGFGYKNDFNTGGFINFPSIWEYNVMNDEWVEIESFPIAFSHKGYHFIFGNKFYFGGGYGSDFGNLRDFFRYEF